MLMLVISDKAVLHSVTFAKQLTAFFMMSRSSV